MNATQTNQESTQETKKLEKNIKEEPDENDDRWGSSAFQGLQLQSFAISIKKGRISLNSGSMFSIFNDHGYVTNIREAKRPIKMLTNGGSWIIRQTAQFDEYRPVWFNEKVITNISGLSGL